MKTKIYFLLLFLATAKMLGQEFNLVKNIASNDQFSIKNSQPTNLFVFGEQFFFNADNAINGKELWASNGTNAGTILFKDIAESTSALDVGNSNPSSFIKVNNLFYFIADGNIWQSDGTAQNTIEFLSLDSFENSTAVNSLAYLNGKFYFNMSADKDNLPASYKNRGNEVWYTDGTVNGTHLLKDIAPNTGNSNPNNIFVYDNKLYFTARNNGNNEELWLSDGTTNGTSVLKEINAGSEGSFPSSFTVYDNRLYFSAKSSEFGKELWSTNGETSDTRQEIDINPGVSDANPANLAVYKNKLYFRATIDAAANNDIETGSELWVFDATTNIATLVKDIYAGNLGSNPANFIVYNDKLYFSAIETYAGNTFTRERLYVTNGTAAGTQKVVDTNGNEGIAPSNIIKFNEKLFFSGYGEETGFELFSFTDDNVITTPETTTITDNAFEQYLIDELLDDVLDDKVLTENINTLTSLDLSNLGVEDLTGIEDFAMLQELTLDGNTGITSFDLINTTNLTKFSCNNMGLTQLDLSSYGNLQELSVNNNGLSTLDVSGNFNLKKLDISNNNFTALNTNTLYQITHLDCSFNQISSLEVSFLNQLQELVCNNNSLQELNFNGLGSVTKIIANNNRLENLNLNTGNVTAIQEFNTLQNTNLTCIEVDNVSYATTNFTNIDAQTSFNTNCANLAKTFVPDNNFEQYLIDRGLDNGLDDYVLTENINALTNVDVKQREIKSLEGIQDFAALQHLDASNNQITALRLQDISNLITINVSSNNLSVFKLNVDNIQIFHSENNANLTCIEVNNLAATNNFAFAGNPDFSKDSQSNFSTNCNGLETYIPDDNFEQFLINSGKDDVLDDYVLTANINQIEELTMVAKGVRDLTGIQDFEALQTLDVSANLLTEIVITNLNSNLETLYAGSNKLTKLDTWSSTSLKNVSANNNELTTVKVSNLTRKLSLQSNKFTTLNFSNLALNYLEELDIKGNDELTEINLNKMISLIKLDASYCNLSNIELSAKTKLKTLNVRNNNITNLNLALLFDLEELHCRDNNMQTLTLDKHSSKSLKTLDCSFNNLTTLDVSQTENLEKLRVNDNNLTSLNLKINLENLPKLTDFASVRNANLTCIDVADVAYATENYTVIDNHTNFFINCSFFGGDYVFMPDDNFESKFDDTLDDFVLKSIVENRETLSILSSEISDLTGIEAFTNLKSLSMSFNTVKNLDLSSNLLLETVSAQDNGLESVILPETATLKDVDFYNNKLTTFDIRFLPNLERLLLSGNKLTTINLSNNEKLNELQIAGNEIEQIDISNNLKLKIFEASFMGMNTFMGLKTIDVSNNRFLEDLGLRGNNLSVLNLTNNIRLTDFEARSNNLTCINVFDIDFANQNWADNIDNSANFGTNCYTEIPDTNFEKALVEKGLDNVIDGFVVTNNINTTEILTLISAKIEDLTGIENFTALTSLTLKGNNLTSVDLSNNTLLTNLNISNNFLLDRLDISNNTNLNTFEAINVELTCIKVWDLNYANSNWADKIDSDVVFSLDCNDVWTVDVDDKTQAVLNNVNGLDANNDGKITLKEASDFVGELDLSDKNLDDIKGLKAFSNIKSLNLSGNNLKDLSALTDKKITLISKNTGKKREVEAEASGLETLIISNNSFETLNLEALKNLKIIDLSNNPNLGTVSIKNGNNTNITFFSSTNTPNLTCIIVDDKNANYLSNFSKDSNNKFVADLADCRSTVLNTDDFLQKDVNVFPNPVSNFLTIESTIKIDFIEIYNSIGKRVLKTNQHKIDVSSLSSGMYLIKIISDDKLLTKRILKN